MGEYLSTPNKTKHSSEGANSTLKFGSCSMQGWRKSNEDAHINATDFEPGISLFAVFDGHGGVEVAKYCERHFLAELKSDEQFRTQNYEQALINVFVKIDKMLLSPQGKKELDKIGRSKPGHVAGTDYAYQAGCTANVVLITPTHVYCSNAGDSRCVASQKGAAVDLSEDHKPDLPSERSRVLHAGHMVEEGRVDGIIAISRAIGDWEYKSPNLEAQKMAVSAYPEVRSFEISADLDFLICACDGIWDCMTSQQAVDFVLMAKDKVANYTPVSPIKAAAGSPTKLGKSRSLAGKSPPRKGSKGTKLQNKLEESINNSKF